MRTKRPTILIAILVFLILTLIRNIYINKIIDERKYLPTEDNISLVNYFNGKIKETTLESKLNSFFGYINDKLNVFNKSKTGLSEELDRVVINIVCKNSSGDSSYTGSGVLISSDGLVVTSAHVAQLFLLEDHSDEYNCTIYRYDDWDFNYSADVVYFPTKWIEKNLEYIRGEKIVGTGEFDYALLVLKDKNGKDVDESQKFPYIDIYTDYNIDIKQLVLVAGYPNMERSPETSRGSGKLLIDLSEIEDVFTLISGKVDIFTSSNSILGAAGSSGGGVFSLVDNVNLKLVGLITSVSDSSGNAKINSISMSYIRKSMEIESDADIYDYINGDIYKLLEGFRENDLEMLIDKLKS